jgi:hypothetical protein
LGDRWFSDRESEQEEEDEYYDYESFDEFMNPVGTITDDGEGESVDFLMDEPEVMSPEDLMAFFHVAEEAGLRSQERRRGGRRALQEEAV